MTVVPKLIVFPGSFAPLHEGHLKVASYIDNLFKKDYYLRFEICKEAYDKGTISDEEIQKRCKQFHMIGRDVVVTTNTSFVEKIQNIHQYFPTYGFKVYFAIGWDTARRLCDSKYYFDSELEMLRCINILKERKATFLVFPRNGKLHEEIIPELAEICEFQTEFEQINVSSTQLRTKGEK
jgi:nicotinic acid mononucleotide adenylyltransferase